MTNKVEMNQGELSEQNEWLEADGLGGFASGTVRGPRTRRYHGLLLTAMTPPTGRVMLVNGLDAWFEHNGVRHALCPHRYLPDVLHPAGAAHLTTYRGDPWPTWSYDLGGGRVIEHQLFVPRDMPAVVLSWRMSGDVSGVFRVRPLVSGRDVHALHRENPAFHFDATGDDSRVVWRPYEQVPAIIAVTNGTYHHEPSWYRNFLYVEERGRGLDFVEDLASFGFFEWHVAKGEEALLVLAAENGNGESILKDGAVTMVKRLRVKERRRRERFPSRLHRAADAYIVQRGAGQSIVAGYPWFTDWGRDTFIAVRGLCVSAGRLSEARNILLRWASEVSQGMLPNRFVESGDAPEFNSVDAALWYVMAVYEFLQAMKTARRRLFARERTELTRAVQAILTGYEVGTRHGISMDTDGLLRAGEPGVQLTWMDAKVGDWVVTPRIGKPVEIQALWLNALRIGHELGGNWLQQFEKGLASFQERFWNADGEFLYDVVDVDHNRGAVDASFRPNQIFAVGGLPYMVCGERHALRVVEQVERRLWTPIGLRTLEPGAPGYRPRYEGGVVERDGAYHQGTVWPWLLGPFVEAWVRVRGGDAAAKRAAYTRFMMPLLEHLDTAGLGHISEIADADAPHDPRGCPFQAWSVGEALRLSVDVLAVHTQPATKKPRTVSSSRSRHRVIG